MFSLFESNRDRSVAGGRFSFSSSEVNDGLSGVRMGEVAGVAAFTTMAGICSELASGSLVEPLETTVVEGEIIVCSRLGCENKKSNSMGEESRR